APAEDASLGPAVVAEIQRGIELLHRLAAPDAGTDLGRFRDAFLARYEDREVPLLEALDEESGVGMGVRSDTAPLLRDLAFPGPAGAATVEWGERQAVLLRKLAAALQTGAREIVLEPADLDRMATKDPAPLPDALS